MIGVSTVKGLLARLRKSRYDSLCLFQNSIFSPLISGRQLPLVLTAVVSRWRGGKRLYGGLAAKLEESYSTIELVLNSDSLARKSW